MMNLDPSQPDRVDLSSLDPDHDAAAAERLVSQVFQRIAERDRHPLPVDPLVGVWSLALPMGLAASLAVIGTLALGPRSSAVTGAMPTVAEAMGVPPEFLRGDASSPGAREMKP